MSHWCCRTAEWSLVAGATGLHRPRPDIRRGDSSFNAAGDRHRRNRMCQLKRSWIQGHGLARQEGDDWRGSLRGERPEHDTLLDDANINEAGNVLRRRGRRRRLSPSSQLLISAHLGWNQAISSNRRLAKLSCCAILCFCKVRKRGRCMGTGLPSGARKKLLRTAVSFDSISMIKMLQEG